MELFINNSNCVPIFFVKIFALKQFLLFVAVVFLFNTSVFAQGPVIAYSPATNNLTAGTPFTITPTNSGGAVPATIYGQVTTVAGAGSSGYVNATGTAAFFNTPEAIAGDANGNLYVADDHNNAIRKITPAGVVTTFAGSPTGAQGDVNGTGTAALFFHPDGIVVDGSGNVFISDGKNNKIKKITSAGVVTTIATVTGPAGLRLDGSGNLIVAEQGTSQIIQVAPNGTITNIAGSGSAGSANGTGTAAQFNNPNDVTLDGAGNIFVADYLNNEIRKIAPGGIVTVFAGSTAAGYANATGAAAQFNNPTGIALGSGGVIYVADFVNNDIRKIMPDGTVSLVAGSPTQASGATDGTGTAALFNQPDALYIDASGTGYVTEYQNSTVRKIILTGYTIDKPLPAGLTFDQTTGTISGTPAGTFAATAYTVTAYNATGYSATTITLSCTAKNDWLGNNTTDWNTDANWSLSHVPTTTETAQIGVVPYLGNVQPDVTADATVNSVIFGPNNTPVLTINSGKTLTITDGLTVNLSSTATINGPGTINISGSSLINNTASLTASLNAVIALGAAPSTLANSGTFTLSSDVNGSSSIAAIPAGATITGTVNVQRFIQGNNDINKRGYRLISSAVHTGNDGTSNVFDLQYLANSIHVSGPGYAANGFNVTTTANPSIYLFREDDPPPPANNTLFTTGYNWKGVAKINSTPAYMIGTQNKTDQFNLLDTLTTIPVGNGILVFFRGSLSQAVLPISPPNDVTLSQTGTLNTGTINVKLWFANAANGLGNNFSYTNPSTHSQYSTSTALLTSGFTLVGNPYPSTINWEKYNMNGANSSIYGSNLSTTIYVFDVMNKQYEAYIPALDGDTTNIIPPNASASGPAASNMIASGQGFFVIALGQGGTLSFRETAKTSTQPVATQLNRLMGTPKHLAAAPKPLLRLKLSMDSINTDETVIRLDNNAKPKFVINEDALNIGGNGSLVRLSSISSDSLKLAINALPFPGQQQQVIPLFANASTSGTYQLAATKIDYLPSLYEVWLKDAVTADSLQMKANTNYQFTIDKKNPATFGGARFTLIIRQNPALVYKLLNFTAGKIPTATQVQVVWKTENEQNYTKFTVERSTDAGKTFDVLGGLQGTGAGTYSLLDKNPLIGQNLYRLKQEDINNAITYSKVVTVQYSDVSNNGISNNLNLYPNPANNSINLAIIAASIEATTYNIKFINSSGLVVKEINSPQPTWQGNITSLKPGTYFVRVFSNKDQSLVGRTKFVKL
ncbi:MAG: type sorting protein [Mucilaginibacter sp.]|nr:type sorting protein [Mucilaginibacter sp.]